MKCIRVFNPEFNGFDVRPGTILQLPDDVARRVVQEEKESNRFLDRSHYVSRSVWKREVRDVQKGNN